MFRTKPQIGLEMIDRALAHGVCVWAWTFDEAYGRDTAFLDGLEQRRQVFVGEVPTNFHGTRPFWPSTPSQGDSLHGSCNQPPGPAARNAMSRKKP